MRNLRDSGLALPFHGNDHAMDRADLPYHGSDRVERVDLPYYGSDGAEGLDLPYHGSDGAEGVDLPYHGSDGAQRLNLPYHGRDGAEGVDLPYHGRDGAEGVDLPYHGSDRRGRSLLSRARAPLLQREASSTDHGGSRDVFDGSGPKNWGKLTPATAIKPTKGGSSRVSTSI